MTIASINDWTDSDINNYGLRVIPVANTPGNAMVVYVAWNCANGVNPISNVSDDAHNYWVHLGTSSSSGQVRCAIWMCANTRAGVGSNGGSSTVSVSLSQWTGGISASVKELTGCPTYVQLDGTPVTSFNNVATSQSASATAHGNDLALAMAVTGNINQTLTGTGIMHPGVSVPAIQTTGSGTTIHGPMWLEVAAGGVTESWSVSSAAPMASLMVLVTESPTAPHQPNAKWPAFSIQAAFGYNPGDPTVMPTWTDITARAIDQDGATTLTAGRGRGYELTTPEAGDLTIQLDNHDGALVPGYSGSPYYPNVTLETPLRVLATWNGVTYGVGYAYISALPQEWPDPQWGFVPVVAIDAMGVLSNVQMFSSYSSEVLIDQPYCYFTFAEFYSDANGEPFNNTAFGNNRPAIGVDDIVDGVPLETGLNLGLHGDSSGGIGQSGEGTNKFASTGALYEDPNLPQAVTNGITVECWANSPPTPTGDSSTNGVTLLNVYGDPPNYAPNSFSVPPVISIGMQVDALAVKTGEIIYGFADFAGRSAFRTITPKVVVDGNPHHHVLTVSATSSYTANYYFDGVLIDTFNPSSSTVNVTSALRTLVTGAFALNGNPAGLGNNNYVMGRTAIYPQVLDAARIKKHANAGLFGSINDSGMRRFTKILAWGRAGVPKASGPESANPLMGYADSYEGTSIVDALGTVSLAEGGIPYADSFGVVTFLARTSMYNLTPKYTFGDNTGETHYDPGAGFGYDATYLYNQVNAQRQISQSSGNVIGPVGGSQQVTYQTTGATATVSDTASEIAYLPRNALSETIEVTSDQDSYDWANWNLAKYKQPAFRVKTIVLTPSADTSIWPVALGVEQGDVVKVNRRPVGGAPYSIVGVVQKVEHTVGPGSWVTTLTISPYTIEANVLQLGVAGFNSVTTNRIGW